MLSRTSFGLEQVPSSLQASVSLAGMHQRRTDAPQWTEGRLKAQGKFKTTKRRKDVRQRDVLLQHLIGQKSSAQIIPDRGMHLLSRKTRSQVKVALYGEGSDNPPCPWKQTNETSHSQGWQVKLKPVVTALRKMWLHETPCQTAGARHLAMGRGGAGRGREANTGATEGRPGWERIQ